MKKSKTLILLTKKSLRIFSFLILIRLLLNIPIPGLDLDILIQNKELNSSLLFVKNLTGSSFLAIGYLGILPYINSSILIQLLTLKVESLARLQKEDGAFGRKKIKRYTRYLTFIWSIVLSTFLTFILVAPVVFNLTNHLLINIICSLVTGSMVSMFFAELITAENLGNGSSMIIFINIIGGLPETISLPVLNFKNESFGNSFLTASVAFTIYILIVAIVVLVQESYKRVIIVSVKQLGSDFPLFGSASIEEMSYLPIKLNPGGIMPLVFSAAVLSVLFYGLKFLVPGGLFVGESGQLISILNFLLNFLLVILFSTSYSLFLFNPNDLSQNLTKMSFNIIGLKQGKDTTRYLEKTTRRLAFMGGIFLAVLGVLPLLLEGLLHVNLFRNLSSLILLIGVITEVTFLVKGFLVFKNYESS
jgi:preprotein translocase subunit SecY